jgi:hypothetical protein
MESSDLNGPSRGSRTFTIPAPFVGKRSDYPRLMPIVAVVWLVVVVAGSFVIGICMLRRQQRIYRESDGPRDLYRADDLEDGEPFDPKAGPQADENFFAEGGKAQWMRGFEPSRSVRVHPPGIPQKELVVSGRSTIMRDGVLTLSAAMKPGGSQVVRQPAWFVMAGSNHTTIRQIRGPRGSPNAPVPPSNWSTLIRVGDPFSSQDARKATPPPRYRRRLGTSTGTTCDTCK